MVVGWFFCFLFLFGHFALASQFSGFYSQPCLSWDFFLFFTNWSLHRWSFYHEILSSYFSESVATFVRLLPRMTMTVSTIPQNHIPEMGRIFLIYGAGCTILINYWCILNLGDIFSCSWRIIRTYNSWRSTSRKLSSNRSFFCRFFLSQVIVVRLVAVGGFCWFFRMTGHLSMLSTLLDMPLKEILIFWYWVWIGPRFFKALSWGILAFTVGRLSLEIQFLIFFLFALALPKFSRG